MGRSAKKSTVFLLKGVKAQQVILSHYAPCDGKAIDVSGDSKNELPQTVVNFDDTVSDDTKTKNSILFLDSHKNQIRYWPNMVDGNSGGVLPRMSNKPCWWCRCCFTSAPVGCPLRYNSSKTSGIDKDRMVERLSKNNLPTDTTDYFETEGIFCSFPCTKAYIISQGTSALYKESLTLLTLLCKILYNTDPLSSPIPVAPSWKLLKEYGGHLTINQFRSSFSRIEYRETVNVRRPYMYCSSKYISETKNRTS